MNDTNNENKALNNYFDYLWRRLASDAKEQNIDVSITLDDIKELYKTQNYRCSLTGKEMTYNIPGKRYGNKHRSNISVDRIDPSRGLKPGNITIVRAYVNCYHNEELPPGELINISIKTIIHNLHLYTAEQRSKLLLACLKADCEDNPLSDMLKADYKDNE